MNAIQPQPMCPQFWRVFAVRGSAEAPYTVMFDNPVAGQAKCTCEAFKFSPRVTCKHIERVMKYGCFGYGPNDLPPDVVMLGANPNLATTETSTLCKVWQADAAA